MELKVDIEFNQLLHAIKQLPDSQLSILKKVLNNNDTPANRSDLKSFLLNGPVFNDTQLKEITDTRKHINQWRTK